MTRKQILLIKHAASIYGDIKPCTGTTFPESFTSEDKQLLFWFNDSKGNTHTLDESILLPGQRSAQ